jgi:hypothetical protein
MHSDATVLLSRCGHDPAVAEQSEWATWWKRQGEEELRLILWAAWDPIFLEAL